jgi:hypothetical protein
MNRSTTSNKRMHATRDTHHVIFGEVVGGRVMRGVGRLMAHLEAAGITRARTVSSQIPTGESKMHKTTVICMDQNRRPIAGAKVALQFTFSDHPMSAGFTEGFYTNEKGVATIESANKGPAVLYVDGARFMEVQAGMNYATIVTITR